MPEYRVTHEVGRHPSPPYPGPPADWAASLRRDAAAYLSGRLQRHVIGAAGIRHADRPINRTISVRRPGRAASTPQALNELLVVGAATLAFVSATALLLGAIAI